MVSRGEEVPSQIFGKKSHLFHGSLFLRFLAFSCSTVFFSLGSCSVLVVFAEINGKKDRRKIHKFCGFAIFFQKSFVEPSEILLEISPGITLLSTSRIELSYFSIIFLQNAEILVEFR